MRKPLYANASRPRRDNNYKVNNNIVNNDIVNNNIAVTINNYNNNIVNNYKQDVLKRTLVKMNPAYKKAGEEARQDPLAFRLKKVMKLLRTRLGTQNFIEAVNHVATLSPMEQAKFCQSVEDYYAARCIEHDS